MATTRKPSFYYILAILIQLIVALVPSASMLVITSIPVELYITLRWTLSAFIFLIVSLFIGDFPSLTKRELLSLPILGICGYALSSLGTLYALKIGGIVNFAILTSITPVITATILILVLNEQPSKRFWVAAFFCTIGLCAVTTGKYDLSGSQIAFGSGLLVILAYALQALPFAYSKKFESKIPLIHYMTILQISAAAFMWMLELFWFQQLQNLPPVATTTWTALIFVSLASCCIGFIATYWLLRHLEGHKLALFEGLHPIFASVYAVLLFDETFNLLMVLGGFFLIVSLAIASLPKTPAAKAPDSPNLQKN